MRNLELKMLELEIQAQEDSKDMMPIVQAMRDWNMDNMANLLLVEYHKKINRLLKEFVNEYLK